MRPTESLFKMLREFGMRAARLLAGTHAPMMESLKANGRDLKPHKATISPQLSARTVLTNSPWEFVALWLERNQKPDARFFWDQAKVFADAALGIPVQSAPLLLYYSFMNATKALLSAKAVPFQPRHGVRAHNMRGPSTVIELSNEGVQIEQRGILPSLAAYLNERETSRHHSLEEILFNIPCVHRTFCLTYPGQADLFIPLTDCRYVFDQVSRQAHLAANLSRDYASAAHLATLPSSLIADRTAPDIRGIRSAVSVPVSAPVISSVADMASLETLNMQLRPDLNYINGAQTLWYAKVQVTGPARLQRSPLTLTLAAMHRLSEICRYRPVELSAFLSSQQNWLLTEFIRMSPMQFLDEISAEITGHQFMAPNVRTAT